MILLIGTSEDPTTMYFAEFLNLNGVQHFILDQKLLADSVISLFSNHLISAGKKFYYCDFSGTLNRMSAPDYPNLSDKVLKAAFRNDSFINYIMSYKLNNVLNLNHNSISNDSKLFQLYLIKDVIKSIKIPSYVVMKNYDIEQHLYKNSSNQKHIVKSLSSIRSIVKEYESNKNTFDLEQSDEPVQFQELLNGINLRVHVIDEYVFCVKIASDTVDYRYENTIQKFEQCIIPEDIQDECVKISKTLNLRFAGVDLLLTENGEYYIFEINPSPGYSYFEEKIGTKFMSEKLLEVLSK